jgi:hypothetical protein
MVTKYLFTPEGGFVTEIVMPEFKDTPEVCIWGGRVFVYVEGYSGLEEVLKERPFSLDILRDEEGVYVEAFGYFVPPDKLPAPLLPPMIYGDDPLSVVAAKIKGEHIAGDRVYVPDQEPGVMRRLCECNLERGYHFNTCIIATTGVKAGIARAVYVKPVEEGGPELCEYCNARGSHQILCPRIKWGKAGFEPEEAPSRMAPGTPFNCSFCFSGVTFINDATHPSYGDIRFCREECKEHYIRRNAEPVGPDSFGGSDY